MTEPRRPDPVNPRNPIPARNAQPEEWGDHFAAPLGSSRSGRLRFMNGAHQIVIRSDSRERSLYRARFGSQTPTVGVQGDVVTVRYPRSPTDDWLGYRSERTAEIVLNTSIPWDFEFRGGASRLLADLRGLRLSSLNLDGGANRLEVRLPPPTGAVRIAILGGASNVSIHGPAAVGARLLVSGGVTNLRIDDRHIGGAGSELDLRSTDYDGTTGRYDIAITGGANNVSIVRRRVQNEGVERDR
jgi:hypothetical protein